MYHCQSLCGSPSPSPPFQQRHHSSKVQASCTMTAPPRPWEIDDRARRRAIPHDSNRLVGTHSQRERERDACLEALMDHQDWKDKRYGLRGQGILFRPLVWTAGGRPHPADTRTLRHAADTASSRNGQQMLAKSLQRRWKHEIQIALLRRRAPTTRAVLPNPSARAEWLLAAQTELSVIGSEPPAHDGRDDDDDDDSDTGTDTTTPDDDNEFTGQQSTPARLLELEALFQDHGVCSGLVIDSLALERVLHEQRALAQPLPSAIHLDQRQRGPISCLISLSPLLFQVLDTTHIWSGNDSDVIEPDDILALAAAVNVLIKLHLSPQQSKARTLPELLTAVAALLARPQPDDALVLHSACTIQQVTHIEFRMLEQLGQELATLTLHGLG